MAKFAGCRRLSLIVVALLLVLTTSVINRQHCCAAQPSYYLADADDISQVPLPLRNAIYRRLLSLQNEIQRYKKGRTCPWKLCGGMKLKGKRFEPFIDSSMVQL